MCRRDKESTVGRREGEGSDQSVVGERTKIIDERRTTTSSETMDSLTPTHPHSLQSLNAKIILFRNVSLLAVASHTRSFYLTDLPTEFLFFRID